MRVCPSAAVEGNMAALIETKRYVWRRNTEPVSSRWVWWIIGPVVALTLFGAFAAYMADNGEILTMLGFGAVCSVLVWLVPRVYGWGRRRNPDITMEGREMVWAKKRVPIDEVERWSARLQTTRSSNGTVSSSMTIGVVRFKMLGEKKETTFTFPHLEKLELAELIAAIDPVLPGRRTDDLNL